jgi:hypothetical protein
MRELAHQELGMLSPRLQLRCGGAHVGDQRVGFDKRRRRVATLLPLPSVRSATVAESRERHEPKMRTRVPRPASVQRELEARKASASPTAIQLIGTCRRTVRPCALTTVYYSLTVTSALGSFAEMRGSRRRVRSTLRSGHRSAPKQRPVRANRPNVSSTCRAAATDVHRRASLSLVSATGAAENHQLSQRIGSLDLLILGSEDQA